MKSAPAPRDVAIVHDYLNQRGGAERVVLELSEIWPDAPIYTSLYRPRSTFPEFVGRDIRTTVLNSLPVDRRFRSLLPLYAPAFSALKPIDADVVIASSSGWAHMARTTARALHVVYCHNPARWLYGTEHLHRTVGHRLATPTFAGLRLVDRSAAKRADIYIANSENVRQRIWDTYGINAEVLRPPVPIHKFKPAPRGDRLLIVSRLLPYKHVEPVIRATKRAGLGLDVVGTGPLLGELQMLAGPGVKFHGAVTDEELVRLMEACWAVCVPAEEDFGIVSVEAQAAGKPVIAYAAGGSLETVVDGVTGVLFTDRSEQTLLAAFDEAACITLTPQEIAAFSRPFSSDVFRSKLLQIIENGLRHRDATFDARREFTVGAGALGQKLRSR